jgi:NAD(P)H-hydrate epimerase
MQAVEQEANAAGLTYGLMMENAGSGLADVVQEDFGQQKDAGVLGLVGSGNNGGDTLVALAALADRGWKASAYLVRARPKEDPLLKRVKDKEVLILNVDDDPGFIKLDALLKEHAVLLDGILGTGIKLPLRGKVAEVLGFIKNALDVQPRSGTVVAVDCPSGVDCASGEAAAEAIAADLTVTMAAAKIGLLMFPANNYIGELKLVGIGLEDREKNLKTWQGIRRRVVDLEWVKQILPRRPRDAHKGTFGTAMIVAGSVNFTGAAYLAGKAAYLAGVGLVTLAVPAPLHAALAGQFPEATWLLLPDAMGVINDDASEVIYANLGQATAILIGPGFGLEDETEKFLTRLLTTKKQRGKIGFLPSNSQSISGTQSIVPLPPAVIDADGLKLLSRIPQWSSLFPDPAVLTPHPGEMAILTGLEISEIQADRIQTAERFAAEWGHIVVLKGANTVIASPERGSAVVPVATPALARAGTGDVLAGLIVGLRAQGVEAFEAAVCGCWLHAQSGLAAAGQIGTTRSVLAGNLLGSIASVISEVERFTS